MHPDREKGRLFRGNEGFVTPTGLMIIEVAGPLECCASGNKEPSMAMSCPCMSLESWSVPLGMEDLQQRRRNMGSAFKSPHDPQPISHPEAA